MSRVLSKEVAPFNIRVLTVLLGTFNTNMGNATVLGKTPIPEDYNGSVADQMMKYMASGAFNPPGDKDKAMKAVYEVVVSEGVGAGREAERFLPLGKDLVARIKQIQDGYTHTLEVFEDVASNVNRDDI
jgi:NAD(P)-dependent dehydrogenase (short-subunit alcohol dehydrogenase family)